ncbi:hypothetical protein [Cellvibrio sp. pealriver]|uniref:hypothetical protein n=1 Tax=Cellvibrio sp. pealriver TaxID=1622269 RepID=UPI000ADC50F7|nr:hypothetical protein [Cellvibrio sp. pealriver]
MRLHKLFRHRGLGINLLASFCFLMLAVYGWGMSWKELGSYLLVLLSLLVCLIIVAAVFAWLLGKLRSGGDDGIDVNTRTDASPQTDDSIDDEIKK